MNCAYRFCEAALPLAINGNRRYCDEDCYMAEKLVRTKDIYESTKESLAEIIRVEKLLRLSFNKYNLHNFDANILRLEKMNWTIYTNLTIIDGLNIRVIGQYGYVFFDNNTIKIYKL